MAIFLQAITRESILFEAARESENVSRLSPIQFITLRPSRIHTLHGGRHKGQHSFRDAGSVSFASWRFRQYKVL